MTDTINTLADPGSDPAHEWQQPENAETILHASRLHRCGHTRTGSAMAPCLPEHLRREGRPFGG
ncbi:hypothetical protein GS883_18265 [Rhodococcus hoagii]|nr:hypothetical protein [Prescottella equi]